MYLHARDCSHAKNIVILHNIVYKSKKYVLALSIRFFEAPSVGLLLLSILLFFYRLDGFSYELKCSLCFSLSN